MVTSEVTNFTFVVRIYKINLNKMGKVKEEIYKMAEMVEQIIDSGVSDQELDEFMEMELKDKPGYYEFYHAHKDIIFDMLGYMNESLNEAQTLASLEKKLKFYEDQMERINKNKPKRNAADIQKRKKAGEHNVLNKINAAEDQWKRAHETCKRKKNKIKVRIENLKKKQKLNEKLVGSSSPQERFIDLKGPSGNAFAILGMAMNLCRQLKDIDPETYDWKKIEAEMKASDYKNLVKTFEKYFGDYVTIYNADVIEEGDNLEESYIMPSLDEGCNCGGKRRPIRRPTFIKRPLVKKLHESEGFIPNYEEWLDDVFWAMYMLLDHDADEDYCKELFKKYEDELKDIFEESGDVDEAARLVIANDEEDNADEYRKWCKECGSELEDGVCPDCGWSREAMDESFVMPLLNEGWDEDRDGEEPVWKFNNKKPIKSSEPEMDDDEWYDEVYDYLSKDFEIPTEDDILDTFMTIVSDELEELRLNDVSPSDAAARVAANEDALDELWSLVGERDEEDDEEMDESFVMRPLNEVDYAHMAQVNRDVNRGNRFVGGYNREMRPKKDVPLSGDTYDYTERKEAAKHIGKKHSLLKMMGYDLDTDEEKPDRAPSPREAKKVKDPILMHKLIRRSKFFNKLKSELGKEETLMDRLHKKHLKGAKFESVNESFNTWYQENKDADILLDEYRDYLLDEVQAKKMIFKQWCREKYEWLKEYERNVD
jgi:hypothetical protein